MNIPLIKPDLPSLEEVKEEFGEILQNGKITNFGKYVTAFEEKTGAYLGAETVTVSSGTMGLIFALQALGIKPGQKVIVPSFTFIATAQAVLYAGCIPLFAEVDDDLTLSLGDLEILLNAHSDIAAVIPVHTYGLPCKTLEIEALTEGKIPVLYDAAHAFGSAIGKKKVGGFGSAEVFSLSVTKALVSVEGGLVASHNSDLIHRIRKMRNYGIRENYDAHWSGLNGKMSEFHAIIGLYNLERLDGYLEKRKKMGSYFIDQIQKQTVFKTQPLSEEVTHTFKDVTILIPEDALSKRNAIMAFLKERGIETRAYFFPPVHEQAFFKRYADRRLPQTEKLSRRVITLPFYTTISKEEINTLVEALREANRTLL